MVTESTIKQTITKLIDTYNPSEIYLFGSYVWGRPDSESDLDILVIVDQSDEKFYKRPIKGIEALKGLKIPKDIIVYTRAEFDQISEELSSLCYKVKNEGKKVYEAA